MLDFLRVSTRIPKKGVVEVYPKFIVKSSSDLMIRGGDFYAIWNEETKMWSRNEDVALYLIDKALDEYAKEHHEEFENIKILHLWDSDTGMIDKWHKYLQKQMWDNYHQLDEKLIFSNTETTKEDYASRKLPYALAKGDHKNYDELVDKLYSPAERKKFEWAVGSIINGDSKDIQKFLVFYGGPGTGKSTVLNIIQDLLEGYYCTFDAKALGSSNNAFALEAFRTNPLAAIQQDGDLSKIEDNTRLNSVVSHELMTVNEKFKSTYSERFNCFLFMGTNKPVRITDAKSGILRRLIDVSPTGEKFGIKQYEKLKKGAKFELGAIAYHCKEVYEKDPHAYDGYTPTSMMGASNDFYNYVLDSYDVFNSDEGVTLKAAWTMYKEYCEDAKVQYPYALKNFKEELKSYFKTFDEHYIAEDGTKIRNIYHGFIDKSIELAKEEVKDKPWLIFEEQHSLFDDLFFDAPAQYANANETPEKKWSEVTTALKDLDTKKLHYVKTQETDANYIQVDFDIRDENGNKNYALNYAAAIKWPETYAELSKSGQGIHLCYNYIGDVNRLAAVYDKDIEIKVYKGNSSLRRKLTKCNSLPIASISAGLPLKEEKQKVLDSNTIKSEKTLRNFIVRNLNKEIHSATKPSIDFICTKLEECYASGLKYDVSDMEQTIMAFAASSTHNAKYCVDVVSKMKFKSDDPSDSINTEAPIIFLDTEVYSNLFLVCYKLQGEDKKVVRLYNPTPQDIEKLLKYRIIGYNNRKYDNHILYARLMGYSNEQLFKLSQNLIQRSVGYFGEAYNLSYTDVLDFAATKQSLKKWEIDLHIHHQEMGIPWDKPAPEELWEKIGEYCENDVIATEKVFDHLAGDFLAREILADVAGMTPNDTTNSLTTRIIFGKERHPELVYTDLSKEFPGYEFKNGQNWYRGENVGFGGYVYANPGMYSRVVTFDVASMHPSSIIAMNCFGEYTKRFKEILEARIAIKHKDFEKAKKMLGGKLAKYLDDPSKAKMLAQALKIAINSVYGLTSAKFDNPFRDVRNVNNIVALRGALFMVTLRDEIIKRGFTVAHIKTDSIKVVNPTPEIMDYILEFGKKYGYNFEIEHIFEKICLVNNAVYVAKLAEDDPDWMEAAKKAKEKGEKEPTRWTATGAQFQQPYVFKKLFSNEPIEFYDLCTTREVKAGELYLDMNEKLAADEHNNTYIGRIGLFAPIISGRGGGELYRMKTENGIDKYYAAAGTKGYRWLEAETVKALGMEDAIDISYHDKLVDEAIASIKEYGNVNTFVEKTVTNYI